MNNIERVARALFEDRWGEPAPEKFHSDSVWLHRARIAYEIMRPEVEALREALIDTRNLVLCPVGPSPTLDELQEIASAALASSGIDK